MRRIISPDRLSLLSQEGRLTRCRRHQGAPTEEVEKCYQCEHYRQCERDLTRCPCGCDSETGGAYCERSVTDSLAARQVPRRYHFARPWDVGEKAAALWDEDGVLRVLYGPVDGGKSHAAAAWLAARPWIAGRWVSAIEYAQRCRHWSGDDLRKGCIAAPLLVLDNLGPQGLGDGAIVALIHLLEARYQELRETVVTTNLPGREALADVADELAGPGERLASLLGGAGGSRADEVQWIEITRGG